MPTKACLGTAPEIAIEEVRCHGSPSTVWSPSEVSGTYCLVLVRGGLFRRRVRGTEATLDPAVGYWDRPGEEQQVAHPVDDGDLCTAITLSEDLLAVLAGGEPDVPDGPVFTGDDVDLAHRTLVGRARGGAGSFELTERVVRLVAAVLGQRRPDRVASGRPATTAARRRLVDTAREVLTSGPAHLGLHDLARLVGASPYHVSRVFHAETGLTLTRFRTRLRVRRALERLASGEPNLARLAADLGFSDHAHLTRTVRDHLGHTPIQLRRLLEVDETGRRPARS